MSSHPPYLSCRAPGSAGRHMSHRQCSVAVSELAFLVPSVACQEGRANPFRDTWRVGWPSDTAREQPVQESGQQLVQPGLVPRITPYPGFPAAPALRY